MVLGDRRYQCQIPNGGNKSGVFNLSCQVSTKTSCHTHTIAVQSLGLLSVLGSKMCMTDLFVPEISVKIKNDVSAFDC